MYFFRSLALHLTITLFILMVNHNICFAQNDYYVILTANKPTFAKEGERVIAVMRDKKGKDWQYKIGQPELLHLISESKDSISGDHTFMFRVEAAGVTNIEFSRNNSRNNGKEIQKFDVVATTLDGTIVGDISHLKQFINIDTQPTSPTTKKGYTKPTTSGVALENEPAVVTKNLLESNTINRPIEVEKTPQQEQTQAPQVSAKVEAFQRFHTEAIPLSMNKTTIVDINNQLALDVKNLNHTQKWLIELSDENVLELVDEKLFVGDEIGQEIGDLQAWRFQAKSPGVCYIRLHAINESSWMSKNNDIVYKVWVR